MVKSPRAQMIAVLAIGALLGYVTASSRFDLFRNAKGEPSGSQARRNPVSPALQTTPVSRVPQLNHSVKGTGACCATGSAKTQLVALNNANLQADGKKPNIVMLMTDDTGWNDFGCYSGGGKALGHPTPHVDRIAKEGAMFTSWYGQASCTAGRCSFITGRIPIRSALSIVVAPGDENFLRKETPTIAEFFKKNGYSTYFSGKWHLGDKPESYPIEHGFDEMKAFGAYYPGVYTYSDTSSWFHPWFPSYNPEFAKEYFSIVNMFEWEGTAGQPAKKVGEFSWKYLADFDVR